MERAVAMVAVLTAVVDNLAVDHSAALGFYHDCRDSARSVIPLIRTSSFQTTVGLASYPDSHAPLGHGTLSIRDDPYNPLTLKVGHWRDRDGMEIRGVNGRVDVPSSFAGDAGSSCCSHGVDNGVALPHMLPGLATCDSSGMIHRKCRHQHSRRPCKAESTTHYAFGKH